MPGAPPRLEDVHGLDYETLLAEYRERVQEREVRVAAQRVLRDHLRKGDKVQSQPSFWEDIALDHLAASLVDFDLAGCTAGEAGFRSATFIGDANFEAATFTVVPVGVSAGGFGSATFTGSAHFKAATFSDVAFFMVTRFDRAAFFEKARFDSRADFKRATFVRRTSFAEATSANQPQFTTATVSEGLPPELRSFVGAED